MIRRLLTRILLVVLLAFCGYNWLQARSLQAQVTDLKNRLAMENRRTEAVPDEALLPALLTRADTHAGLARSALARSDWTTARRELQAGIHDLNEAARSPDARHDLTALQAQTQQLQQEAAALWRQAHSQTDRISR